MMNMNRDCVRAELFVNPVELFLQHVLRHDAAEAAHEVFENGEFLARQRQHRRTDPNVPANRVEDDIAGFEHRAERLPGPSQQRLDARDQLNHGKGFDKIVVRTCVQAGHPRLDRNAGCQH